MAYAALIAGVLCISFTAIFTKLAHVPGPVAAAYRMTIATAVLTLPLAWHIHRVGKPRTGVRWGVTGGLWFALNLGLLSSALLRTSAANATLLDNTAPI
jgi:drug/metabolite transporter (DMT)-like permease